MKFWDWYLKISVVSAMIAGSMEFFMALEMQESEHKSNCLVGMMGSTSMVLQVPAVVDEGDGRVGVVGPFQSKGFMEGLEQWELIVMPGRHLVLIRKLTASVMHSHAWSCLLGAQMSTLSGDVATCD
ncbi:hypothetical protein LOK49_LG10G02701 [Camellia lanceoleosa]|uniref:Uncharacterized protein n=1 Tax=Camellia lanceoleosa TaxID=1840588 RepID=A0ACC0GA81_9ERIC|nr:hypothetical protein LOK49_LG10G02701 [Camellia lanceoleosa]